MDKAKEQVLKALKNEVVVKNLSLMGVLVLVIIVGFSMQGSSMNSFSSGNSNYTASMQQVNTGINSYEDCIKAGYQPIGTNPRTCKTVQGQVFTDKQTLYSANVKEDNGEVLGMQSSDTKNTVTPTPSIVDDSKDTGVVQSSLQNTSEAIFCSTDEDCPIGNFCSGKKCVKFDPDLSCKKDADCQIIDKKYYLNCCNKVDCGIIDYSKSNWISVNKTWYSQSRTMSCSTKNSCTKEPVCDNTYQTNTYKAVCDNNQCTKALDKVIVN